MSDRKLLTVSTQIVGTDVGTEAGLTVVIGLEVLVGHPGSGKVGKGEVYAKQPPYMRPQELV
jgi:hypothetical protein